MVIDNLLTDFLAPAMGGGVRMGGRTFEMVIGLSCPRGTWRLSSSRKGRDGENAVRGREGEWEREVRVLCVTKLPLTFCCWTKLPSI